MWGKKYEFTIPEVDTKAGTISWAEGWDLTDPSPYDDFRDHFIRHVCHTREQFIREGLIKLGWTPPPDDPLERAP